MTKHTRTLTKEGGGKSSLFPFSEGMQMLQGVRNSKCAHVFPNGCQCGSYSQYGFKHCRHHHPTDGRVKVFTEKPIQTFPEPVRQPSSTTAARREQSPVQLRADFFTSLEMTLDLAKKAGLVVGINIRQ